MATPECPWQIRADEDTVYCQMSSDMTTTHYSAGNSTCTHTFAMDLTEARAFLNDFTAIVMKMMSENC